MGNTIAKRGRRSSHAVRPIFSPKMEDPQRADGVGGKCESPNQDGSDCNSSNSYLSDIVELGHSGSLCMRNGVNSNSKSHHHRVFSNPSYDLRTRYSVGMELRRGRTGVVRICIDRMTGEKLACKTLDKRFLANKLAVGRIRREAEVMSRVAGHPNVIELKGVCEDAQEAHFIMELATGGDLSDCIISRNHPFPEPLAAKMFKQIALGVQFIHSKGVVHRDLKPENILVMKPNGKRRTGNSQECPLVLKLGDFGMAVKLSNGKRLKGIRGTKVFLAPEMLDRDTDYSFEVDIWSLGVILYVLLFKEIPFNGSTDQELFKNIKAGKLHLDSHSSWGISDPAKELIQKMLTVDPKSRWTIHQVLESSWLKTHCNTV